MPKLQHNSPHAYLDPRYHTTLMSLDLDSSRQPLMSGVGFAPIFPFQDVPLENNPAHRLKPWRTSPYHVPKNVWKGLFPDLPIVRYGIHPNRGITIPSFHHAHDFPYR